MTATDPTIVATSGGVTRPARGDLAFAPLVQHAVDLARPAGRPRIAYLGTAMGDQRWHNAMISEAADRAGYRLEHLKLFPQPTVADLEAPSWPRTSCGSVAARWPTCSRSGGCTGWTRSSDGCGRPGWCSAG
ncbi:hypothetical protein GCM10027055_11760 [Janibacter alkaliphilus]